MKKTVFLFLALAYIAHAESVKKEFTDFTARFNGSEMAISQKGVKMFVEQDHWNAWITMHPQLEKNEFITQYSNNVSVLNYVTNKGRQFRINKSTLKETFGEWFTRTTIQGTYGYSKVLLQTQTHKLYQQNFKDRTFDPVLVEGERIVESKTEGWIATAATFKTNKGRTLRFSQFCENEKNGYCENKH